MRVQSDQAPLVLVDGHHLLWRAYYGFPARITTRAGEDRTGVFGFFALLRVALREVSPPAECVVCFDGEYGATERQKLDANYKRKRQDVDMTPIKSLPDILAGLDWMGVRWFYSDYLEADDVIATLVAREQVRRTYIMSGDRDFYQLVSDNVSVLNTLLKSGRRIVGPGEIIERYGVGPDQWCDYRALTGDASDEIAGVPGIGPIRAAGLLAGGTTLERLNSSFRLPRNVTRWMEDSTNWEAVLAGRDLMRLRTDVDVPDITTGAPTPELPLAAEVLAELDLW